jgi:uncharacterized MnhB-related membrane protein
MIKFVIASAVVFSAGGVIWQKDDTLNLLVKLGFIGLAIWGWYIIFHAH